MSRLRKNKEYYTNVNSTVDEVRKEINAGLALLNDVDKKIITFFGSHRTKPTHPSFKHCNRVAYDLGKRGYAIVTGGGSGIMYAANSGAQRARAPSIGIRASLLNKEFVKTEVFSKHMSFRYLFVRRFILSIKSEAMIFYPGGYGTLNELFEYACLIQTGMVDKVPLICVDKKYWQGLFTWMKNSGLKQGFFNSPKDLELVHLVDDLPDILKLIEKK